MLFHFTSLLLRGCRHPLAKLGFSRDGKPGTLLVSLLTDERCQVASGHSNAFCGATDPTAIYLGRVNVNGPTTRGS